MKLLAGVRAETVAACGLVVALLLHTSADPDLWGHLAFGRQTVHDGLGRVDVFSYTAAGAPVLNHEWLSDVVTYVVFAAGGPAGVVALRLALLLGMLLLVGAAVRRAGGDGLAAALVAALVVVGGFPWFVTARPQLWTFLFFAVFLTAIVRADDGDARVLWLTPLVTVAWVNLHGGVVAGLGVLGCWGALRVAQRMLPGAAARGAPSRGMATAIVAVLGLHGLAALVNPFGLGLWRFFAATLAARRPEIGEWQHVSPTDLGDVLGLVTLAALALLVVRSPRPRDPVYVALATALALAAMGARRHLALALIGAAVLGAPHAAAVLTAAGLPARRSRLAPAAALALVAVLATAGLTRAGCIVVEPGTVPDAAVDYLKRAGVDGRLAVVFDWGSYAIWHLSPRLRVSVDGRREALYTPAQLAEHAAFLRGAPGWRDPLDRDGVDVALVSPRIPAYARLADEPDWRLAFQDGTAALFVRRGSSADASLARTRPPAGVARMCVSRAG